MPSIGGTAPDRADAATLDRAYTALLGALPLSRAHRDALCARGLPDAEIDARGYGTLPVRGRARVAADLRERIGEAVRRVPGIVTRERDGRRYLTVAGAAGLLVPVRDLAGRVVALMVRRDGDSEAPRYSYLSSRSAGGPGPGAPVHVPRGVTGACQTVRLTEGMLKADVAHALTGLPTLGLPGVSAWRPVLPVLRELGARTVRLALDADAADKAAVARALDALAQALDADGLAVELERWPAPHKGIDDALAAGVAVELLTGDTARRGIAELVALGTAGEPPPAPSALDRLPELLADGGPEAVYRAGDVLRALAQLAESDPAEYACRRAQLNRAGIRLRDLDAALAPLRREIRAALPPADTADSYRVAAGRIVRVVLTRDGAVDVPLSTWAGRIVEQVIHDDGAERTTTLAVEGALQDGTPLPRVEVLADDWPYMRWPVERWGPRAVVLAGAATADHLRCALQLLSGDVARRTVYAHAGWREIGGRWVYLHAGGAIGADGPAAGVSVALPDMLAGYTLPDPPTGRALADAVKASLRVLDLAPDPITVPLLGAVYRAVLGPCDSALHLAGPSGQGKSELAALAQQHHGADLDARHLPGSWSSTGNALEALAFAAAHAVMVVDDFAPTGAAGDVQRMHREADRLLRAQGNSAGRQRMRADGSLRPAKPPRGMIVSTGEDVPRGLSLRARLLTLELGPGELDWARLTNCQRDAAAGLYAQALAGYVRWLAPQYPAICAGLRAETAELRARASADGMHARTPGILADLAAGWRHWLDFALAAGAVGPAERDALAGRAWAALRQAGAAQAAHLAAAEPCARLLELLAGAVASGRAHVAGPDGGRPADGAAWGWRDTEPLGRCIGWLDGADLYLQPEAAYAEAQELARHQGDSLPVAARTLWRRLAERGLLASREDARQRYTVRRTLAGARRDVLHIVADALSTCARPSQPSHDAAVPPGERAGPRDGRSLSPSHWDGPTVPRGATVPPSGTRKPRDCRDIGGAGDGWDGRDGPTDIDGPTDTEISAPWSAPVCRYPQHRRRWRSTLGVILCGICTPPAHPGVVAEWLDAAPANGQAGGPDHA